MKYVENVTPLSKLIGLLFLLCLPLLSILFLKTKRNDIARPVMGTIFLVYMLGRNDLVTALYTLTHYLLERKAIAVSLQLHEEKQPQQEQSE